MRTASALSVVLHSAELAKVHMEFQLAVGRRIPLLVASEDVLVFLLLVLLLCHAEGIQAAHLAFVSHCCIPLMEVHVANVTIFMVRVLLMRFHVLHRREILEAVLEGALHFVP
jgi:hypothetical protein